MKTKQEAKRLIGNCYSIARWSEEGTEYPRLSYEDGIRDALAWAYPELDLVVVTRWPFEEEGEGGSDGL